MPNVKCYVSKCKNKVAFRFPKDPLKCAEWLKAIRRTGDEPKGDGGLCSDHFREEDILTESYNSGFALTRKRLRPGASPFIYFPEDQIPPKKTRNIMADLARHQDMPISREDRWHADISEDLFENDDQGIAVLPGNETVETEKDSDVLPFVEVYLEEDERVNTSPDFIFGHEPECGSTFPEVLEERVVTNSDIILDGVIPNPHDFGTEVILSTEDSATLSEERYKKTTAHKAVQCDKPVCIDISVQTHRKLANYTIFDYMDKPETVKYFTGLESFSKFMFVFQSLRTDLFKIKYHDTVVMNVCLEDQFFLTLWKLRRNTPDFELGEHFGISKATVSNIFHSFVIFMTKQWGKVDICPSRSLVNYYMPESFKRSYPNTRVIIDGTEVPIVKPRKPHVQQATFSTYKNKNTVKVLVGNSPSSLISYCSPAFEGSISDCQIVERSNLMEKCDRDDSIMADQGFNVQDLFVSKGVTINIPTVLKGKDHVPGGTLMSDRKLARERVYIERLIGLTKSYKIVSQQMNHFYVPIASEIFYVCVMLCNFCENIVS